jgi:hypothetical protein
LRNDQILPQKEHAATKIYIISTKNTNHQNINQKNKKLQKQPNKQKTQDTKAQTKKTFSTNHKENMIKKITTYKSHLMKFPNTHPKDTQNTKHTKITKHKSNQNKKAQKYTKNSPKTNNNNRKHKIANHI